MNSKLKIYFYHTRLTRESYEEWKDFRFPGHILYGLPLLEKHGIQSVMHRYKPYANRWKLMLYTTKEILFCKEKYEVLYGTSFRGLELIIFLRALGLYRKQIVVWHHTALRKSPNRLKEAISRFFYRGIDHMFLFSRKLIQDSIATHKVPEHKLELIHWGPDLAFYDHLLKELPAEPREGFISTGKENRDLKTMLQAFSQTDENLEVAMRENSAILLEDNYLQKYEGFDPTSSESYIIFEFMQNKHMEQSISLASEVQKCFASAKRNNRGVRQAGFLVLRKTSMPSILVELGYISNPAEERFMRTKEGQNKLATAIYNAFTKYKWEYDRKRGALAGNASAAPILEVADNIDDNQPISAPPGSEEYIRQKNKMEESNQSRVSKSAVSAKQAGRVKKGQTIYKIQILTSDKKLSSGSKLFKGYKNVDYFIEKGIYKYTYGETTSFDSIRKLRRQVAKDFKDAFIVAFKDGKKVKY